MPPLRRLEEQRRGHRAAPAAHMDPPGQLAAFAVANVRFAVEEPPAAPSVPVAR
ncbi:hypothetical protein [Streptomyces sp. NPDC088261]|uniref:hypothetical protein n=1 Tax=Streptomyces sp. NPDC088261 TaxID=3365851 RepID=UPI0038138D39